jgi:hypothetical protein
MMRDIFFTSKFDLVVGKISSAHSSKFRLSTFLNTCSTSIKTMEMIVRALYEILVTSQTCDDNLITPSSICNFRIIVASTRINFSSIFDELNIRLSSLICCLIATTSGTSVTSKVTGGTLRKFYLTLPTNNNYILLSDSIRYLSLASSMNCNVVFL